VPFSTTLKRRTPSEAFRVRMAVALAFGPILPNANGSAGAASDSVPDPSVTRAVTLVIVTFLAAAKLVFATLRLSETVVDPRD